MSALSLIESLEHADRVASLAINSLHCGFTDQMWTLISDKYVWIPLYVAVIVFLFIRLGWRKSLVVTLSLILTILCIDQVANLCKNGFARLRPCYDQVMIAAGVHMPIGARGGQFGFFSGHAANAMGFAVASWLGFRNNDPDRDYGFYLALVTLWALLVGFSRIFLARHFLGDVLTGFVAGGLIAWVIAILTSVICRKFKKRL